MTVRWYDPMPMINRKLDHGLNAVGQILVNEIKIRTPVRTGRLKASIGYYLGLNKILSVFSNVLYAVFVEYGTRNMAPRAMFRRGIAAAKTKIKGIFK